MGILLLTEEATWWRAHPRPEATVAGDTLTLWNYAVGRTALAAEHRAALDHFLLIENLMAPQPMTVVLSVRGHASPTGENARNADLALGRAHAVRDHLVVFGAPRDKITVTAAGASEPLDGDRSGFALARDRRVVVIKFTPPPPKVFDGGPLLDDEPPPPAPTPAPSDLPVRGAQVEGVAGKLGPVPIAVTPFLIDVTLSGTFKGIAADPTGSGAVGGVTVGPKGQIMAGKLEAEIVAGIAAKFSIEVPKGGSAVPTVKAGAQFKGVTGEPEIGVRPPPKFVYVKFTIVETVIHESRDIPPVKITFKGEVQFDIGPGAELVRRLAGLEAALGGTAAAEGFTAAELTAAGIGGGGTATALAAVGGAIGVAVLINGGIILAVTNAKEEADRYTALLARRDGQAARVAWAIIGEAAATSYLNREQQWVTAVASARMLDAFRLGRRDAEALLRVEATRAATITAWTATHAADGTQDFATIRERIYQHVGGIARSADAGGRL